MTINSLPASTSLLAEIDWLAPGRDKGSDGTIGDAVHQAESSDHNPDDTPGSRTPYTDTDTIPEVHARDVDSSGPWPAGWSMERIVQLTLGDQRLQNVIYNRRIWSRSWGWTEHPYTGPDPHTNHAHFSFRYGSGSSITNPENITSAWGIRAAREAEMSEAQPTLTEIKNVVAGMVGDVVKRYEVKDGKVVLVPETDSNPRMMASSALQFIYQQTLLNSLGLQSVLAAVRSTGSVDVAVLAQQISAQLLDPLAERITTALAALPGGIVTKDEVSTVVTQAIESVRLTVQPSS